MKKSNKKTYELTRGLYTVYCQLNEIEYQYIVAHIEKRVDNDMIIITNTNEKVKSSEIFRIEEVVNRTFRLTSDMQSEVIIQAMCSVNTMKNIIQQKNAILDTENYSVDDIDIIENLLSENRIKYNILYDIVELDIY